MLDFYRTQAGRAFFEGHVPAIAKALSQIAEALTAETVVSQELASQAHEALHSAGLQADVDLVDGKLCVYMDISEADEGWALVSAVDELLPLGLKLAFSRSHKGSVSDVLHEFHFVV